MLIEYNDGQTIDTNKLSDLEAMALEKTKTYLDEMNKLQFPVLVRVRLNEKVFNGGWSAKDAKDSPTDALFALVANTVQFIEKCFDDKYRFVCMDHAAYEHFVKDFEDKKE